MNTTNSIAPVDQITPVKEPTVADILARQLKQLVSGLKPGELVNALDKYEGIMAIGDAIENLKSMFRHEQLAYLQMNGTKKTEKGTLVATTPSGWQLEARPRSTLPDKAKVTKLAQEKKLPLDRLMDATITYKPNDMKLEASRLNNEITAEDIEKCRADLVYVVQPPKRVQDE